MGLDLRRVHMDARGSWDITLQNGVDVRFGRRDIEERLGLFVDVVADLVSSREAEIEFVDMRYSNGFTIGWTGEDAEPARVAGQGSAEMVAGTTGGREEVTVE